MAWAAAGGGETKRARAPVVDEAVEWCCEGRVKGGERESRERTDEAAEAPDSGTARCRPECAGGDTAEAAEALSGEKTSFLGNCGEVPSVAPPLPPLWRGDVSAEDGSSGVRWCD